MQKWIIPVNSCLTVLIVVVLALISSDIVSFRLGKVLPKGAPRAAPPEAAKAVSEDLAAYGPILEKGMFGKATQGKLTPIVQSAAGKNPAATSLKDLLLLGTAVGSFRETFALVQKLSTKEERVFRLGDQVFDTGTLATVRKEMAEIETGGKRLKIYTPMTAATESEKTSAYAGQLGAMASQVAAGSFVVDQRSLNAALDNIGQAMTDARLLPSMKDGKVEGFKASEVKPAGVFGMIGIKNGDVLLSINDFPINSPEKAIQSFVSLKGQSKIRLDLIRDGKPSTFDYDIQ